MEGKLHLWPHSAGGAAKPLSTFNVASSSPRYRHVRRQAGRLTEDGRPPGRNSPSRKEIKRQHKDDQVANLSFAGGGEEVREWGGGEVGVGRYRSLIDILSPLS